MFDRVLNTLLLQLLYSMQFKFPCLIQFLQQLIISQFQILSLRENCSYLEFFWSVFCFPAFELNTESYGETEYLSIFSPNAGKHGPRKLRIRTLFTQRLSMMLLMTVNCFLIWFTDENNYVLFLAEVIVRGCYQRKPPATAFGLTQK